MMISILMLLGIQIDNLTKPPLQPDKICGIRCVLYALHSSGIEADLSDIYFNNGRDTFIQGMSVAQLVGTLNKYGLNSEAIKISDTSMMRVVSPVICLIPRGNGETGHYCILERIENGTFFFWDASIGSFSRSSYDVSENGEIVIIVYSSSADVINNVVDELVYTNNIRLASKLLVIAIIVYSLSMLVRFVFLCVVQATRKKESQS